MTCASCAMRIEKKPNKLEGVTATVNLATEKARVWAPEGVDTEALIAEVAKAGYIASLPRSKDDTATGDASEEVQPDTELISLRQRLVGSVALAVPVIAMSMIPAFLFDYWQWASLTLAAPAVLWAAWPFHRAAWDRPAARRRYHGHPGLPRHPVGNAVVAVRTLPRHRRHTRHPLVFSLLPRCHGLASQKLTLVPVSVVKKNRRCDHQTDHMVREHRMRHDLWMTPCRDGRHDHPWLRSAPGGSIERRLDPRANFRWHGSRMAAAARASTRDL